MAAPVALIVAMFSLQQPPEPIESTLTPDSFDSEAAGVLTRDMSQEFADPRPGSESDEAMAEFVQERFEAIPSAEVAEQTFDASFDGEDVSLRNLLLTLPGSSERQVALIAHRDAADGTGAATSIPSTAILLQIASGFSGTTHEKSLVFVSTDGGSIGALGARRFLSDYSERSLLDTAIVISQPAAPDPQAPFVIPWSTGDESTSAALTETANATLSNETGEPAGDPGPLEELMRLAIPTGLGEQGPMIEGGLDAVRISSTGELPLPAEEDTPEEIDAQTIGEFGRSALSLMLALDTAPSPVEHGPEAYMGVAGNLLPGWALAMLALALLLPVAAASFVAVAGAAHSPWQAARAVGWAAMRAVPFGLALLTVYVLAFTAVIPSPEFPFDPQTADLGTKGMIGVVLALAVLGRRGVPAAAAAGAAHLACGVRRGRGARPRVSVRPGALVHQPLPLPPRRDRAPGLGSSRRQGGARPPRDGGPRGRRDDPVLTALADVAGRFDAGPGVVWDLLMLFTSGQMPDSQALLACLIAGCGLALIAAAGERGRRGCRSAQAGSAGRARPPARGAASRVEEEEGAPPLEEGAAEAEPTPPPPESPRALRRRARAGVRWRARSARGGSAHVVEAGGFDLRAFGGRGSKRPSPWTTRPT